jgi:tetratricopeptide (TPR) repeat protein
LKRENLGVGFFVLRLWDEAIQCYQTDAKVPDEIREAYIRLGESYMKKENVARAIEVFGKAVELGREDALTKLGLAYQYAGNVLESMRTLQKRRELRKKYCYDALPILYLARAYAGLKNLAGEIPVYETKLRDYRQWWARQCVAESYLSNHEPRNTKESETRPDHDDASLYQIGKLAKGLN